MRPFHDLVCLHAPLALPPLAGLVLLLLLDIAVDPHNPTFITVHRSCPGTDAPVVPSTFTDWCDGCGLYGETQTHTPLEAGGRSDGVRAGKVAWKTASTRLRLEEASGWWR